MDVSKARDVDEPNSLSIMTKQLDTKPFSRRLISGAVELTLLIAAWVVPKWKQPHVGTVTDEAPEDYPRPRKHELWYLAFMRRHTDGTVSLPNPEAKETEEKICRRPLEQTLAEFESVASKAEERSRAAMTASGFVMTIAGVLVASESHVSQVALAISGASAFVGFFFALLGQGSYVGRRPMSDVSTNDVKSAMTFTIRKDFYAQSSMLIAAAALAIEVGAFARAYL